MKLHTKVESFCKKYKGAIIPVGGIIAILGVSYIANKAYWAGAENGVNTTCLTMMDYFDEIFPEEGKAEEMWEQFRKTCPYIRVARKFLG